MIISLIRLHGSTTADEHYRHHHRLAFAAVDWCLRLHSWLVIPSLIGIIVFVFGLPLPHRPWCLCFHDWPIMLPLKDVFLFIIIQLLPSPSGYAIANWCFFIFTTTRLRYRFASVAIDSCSRLHNYEILSPWWSNFIFIVFCTGKPNCRYFASFATSPTTTSRHSLPRFDAVLFYYNKWFFNIQYFYSDIVSTYLHSSNGYLTTSYSSQLYVRLFSN